MSSHHKHDYIPIAMCLGNDRHALRRATPVKTSCNIRGSQRLYQQSCMMHTSPGCTALHHSRSDTGKFGKNSKCWQSFDVLIMVLKLQSPQDCLYHGSNGSPQCVQ